METPLLQVHNLSVDFTTEKLTSIAVSNISFSVNKGEILAIVGESGSGKSVTALSIIRLLEKNAKTKGNIFFERKNKQTIDIFAATEKEINSIRGNEIAMIFQEPMTSLNPLLNCGFQVMEAIQLHQNISRKNAKEKTIEIFNQVQLPEPEKIMKRFPHQLSGGQKQRVMIAMAMSCRPLLLIADEPTTALDVTVQKNILELIKNLQLQTQMSVVFISHDLGLVSDIADRILVMYKGEIVEQGDCKTILNSPQHPYTKGLLACRANLQNKQTRMPVVSDFLQGKIEKNIQHQPTVSNTSLETHSQILSVKKICVEFPVKKKFFGNASENFKAVDDVSFSISTKEIVGLVGESGCGKTTIGRAILQLIKPTSGEIFFNNIQLNNLSNKELRKYRKDLQIVFQDPYSSLNPRLTIGEAIREPLQVHSILPTGNQQKDKVVELLEKVNLKAEHFNRYPHQFSGGQRQRICIARALAMSPSLLIFDESVSALDLSVQAQMLNLINDLKNEFNFSALFISHDLSVVHYISDRILVMKSGEIIEEGMADDIYFSPKKIYTQNLIASIPGKSLTSLSLKIMP